MLPREKMERSQRFAWHCLPGWVTRTGLLPSLHPWWHSKFSPAPKIKVNLMFFLGTFSPSCHQCPFPQPLCCSNTADANDCEHLVQQPVDLYSVANQSPPSQKWVSFLAKLSAATAASWSPALYQLRSTGLPEILESPNNVHFLKVLLKQLRGWLKSKYVPRITGMEFTLKWPHYS